MSGLASMWRTSLPLRILLLTLGSSLVVLILAGMVLLNQATAGAVEAKRATSISEAAGIQTFMQQQLRLPESRNVAVYERLSRLADTAGAQSGRFKVIIQGPSSVFASSGIDAASVPTVLRAAVGEGTGMFITPTSVRFTDPAQAPVPGWAIGSVLVDGTGERFPVFYIFPLTTEVATLSVLKQAVVMTGAVLLVALALIAYVVTIIVLRPVRRASRTALRLASGNLDERMEVSGTDDIATLAESMNEMADDLQQRIRELETLSMVQRRFVSDVSHEVRTPLTTVKMAADVLFDARADFAPQQARAAELMNLEIDRFDAMLSDLLEISRFDAGAAVLALEETDMEALVRAEIAGQQALAGSLGVSLRVLEVRGDVTALLDGRRIRRILRNLIVNGIEHADGGPIDVTVAGDPDCVAVTVRDHGIGFRPSQATQVFERFWRADPSRARVLGGSGLGLAISLEDARLHHGWLDAWGRPGRGAQFRLVLPKRPGTEVTGSPLDLVPPDERGSGDPV